VAADGAAAGAVVGRPEYGHVVGMVFMGWIAKTVRSQSTSISDGQQEVLTNEFKQIHLKTNEHNRQVIL
jgi:hypothetical protein